MLLSMMKIAPAGPIAIPTLKVLKARPFVKRNLNKMEHGSAGERQAAKKGGKATLLDR